MRVAIYARVSTDDKGQDPENQLHDLRAWCAAAGHAVSREYIDYESGRKGGEKRKQFSLAKVEAQKISERTRAGMSRARAKGIKIGRPKLAAELRHQIARRAAKRGTPYAIAKALGIDRHTVVKYSR
jgi:DNA invertase Pin-like site-specific DNA recombinase